MKATASREWFISYAPIDPRHAQGLRADLLARGPFPSRYDALAEIDLLKQRDEFKGLTLAPVRVDIIVEQSAPPPKPSSPRLRPGAFPGEIVFAIDEPSARLERTSEKRVHLISHLFVSKRLHGIDNRGAMRRQHARYGRHRC